MSQGGLQVAGERTVQNMVKHTMPSHAAARQWRHVALIQGVVCAGLLPRGWKRQPYHGQLQCCNGAPVLAKLTYAKTNSV